MPVGATGFAAITWGAVALVLAVFAYEAYVLVRDAGWVNSV